MAAYGDREEKHLRSPKQFLFPGIRVFPADPHARTMSPKSEMAGTESGKSQLLEGPRGCPLEAVVCGHGTYACAKHSPQLQAVIEIFVRTCKTEWHTRADLGRPF